MIDPDSPPVLTPNFWGRYHEAVLAQRGFSEAELARRTGVAQQVVNRWRFAVVERRAGPPLEWLRQAVTVLGLDERTAEHYVTLGLMTRQPPDCLEWVESLIHRLHLVEDRQHQAGLRFHRRIDQLQRIADRYVTDMRETPATLPALTLTPEIRADLHRVPKWFPGLVRLMIARNLSINDVIRGDTPPK